MRFSSHFVASLVLAIDCTAAVRPKRHGNVATTTLSGGATTSLPNVVVEAPKQVAGHKRRSLMVLQQPGVKVAKNRVWN